MRRKFKGLFSLTIALLMLFSVFTVAPFTVSAAQNETQSVCSNDFDYDVLSDGTIEITGYYGSYTECTIPSTINGYKVTRIGDFAFSSSSLTSVDIPNTVTSIGEYAFCMSELIIIYIPDSVTEIGDSAFSLCESLKEIALGKNLKTIGNRAFECCTELTSISLPSGLTALGEYAFDCCSNLKSITIPDTVTSLGDGVFLSCESLSSVTLGKGITKIPKETFYYCGNLKKLTIPSTVKTIEEEAFCFCGITSISIPNGVVTIGKSAFENSGVSSVTIPNSVTTIGEKAFWYCMNLTSITIPASVTSIGKNAFGHQYYFEPSSFTVKGYKNSVAESYAKSYGFQFVNIGTTVNPTSVKVNRSTLTLGVGESYGIIKTISPSNATQTCTWTSSNSSVASVNSSGKVTAKKAGTANITVKTSNGKTATCKVTVKPAPTSVKISNTSLTLGKGETYIVSQSTNSGSYAWGFSWSSSNTNVATVAKTTANKAKITAVGTGTATITIKTYNGKTATCKVTVKSAQTSVTVDPSTVILGKGESYTVKEITNSGSYANASNLRWSSTNTNVATVTKGSGNQAKITAKSNGTAYIKITLYNGKTAQCKVTVKNAPSSVKTNPTSVILGVGESYTISESTNSGTYANAANLKWSSTNTSVATVTKGEGNKAKITAKGVGTAYVKITLYNGKTAQCKVTVKNAPSSVKTNPTSVTLGVGESYTISESTNSGTYANAANLKWSSTDTNVATVAKGESNKAKITAKGVGTAYIKITLYNGKTATCKVTVKSAPTSVSLSKTSITLNKGKTYTISESTNSGTYANAANLKWSSTDTSVATVTKGSANKAVITAKGVGTAYIKITLYNGKTAQCKVTVQDDYANEVLTLVNKERAKAGVSELKLNSDLTTLANTRAKEIVTNYSHTRSDGTTVFDMAKDKNIKFNVIGENISKGQNTPSEVMNVWMNSTHKQNILGSDYTSLGIGHYQSGNYHYWVQIFIG